MSDSSDDLKTERQGEEIANHQEGICRDFARGVCGRKFCKYKHEKETMRALNFCHDFQNSSCPRPNCKFIHCTPDEEEEYKSTGEMSNQILAEATRKAQLPGVHPVCNQYRKGLCRRSVCKYRHITKEEEEAEIMELIQNNSNGRSRMDHPNFPAVTNSLNGTQHSNVFITTNGVHNVTLEENDYCPPLPKRRFISNELDMEEVEARRRSLFKGYFAGNPPILSGVDARTIMLEEENSLLHKEVAQLKKQVSDLTATNEFLLDQNANLRVSSKRNGSVTVPAVTITNTLPQNNTPQQTQQVIRTVTASVATVPVSIATVSTGTPVTGNPVSIAGCCPSVSIASPAQILAPSQQILVTTNQPNSSQAQLAIAQQNLANNLAQQAQPQLTSQAQQLALASTQQQLTSQAQHVANQQLVIASTPQNQQLINSNQQLASQVQQLGQQLSTQAQQLANQQLTSQAQQLALANPTQAQQQLAVPQQLALVASSQQLEMHSQMSAINTSQALAMSNATQPMVSYPIMTQTMTHALSH